MGHDANPRLVVDLGGVLFTFDHDHRLRQLSAVFSLPSDRLHDLLWTSGLSAAFDSGRYPDARAVRAQIRAVTGFQGADEQLDLAWCSAFQPAWRVRSALEPHRGRLALFTNNGPLEEEVLPRLYPAMFDCFGELLFSSRLGHRKPDPAAFSAVSQRLRATPDQILLIDDSPANTSAARKAGWTAYTFQGADDEGFELALQHPR